MNSVYSWSVALFLATYFALIGSTNGFGIFQNYEVHVMNNFANNANELTVHCQSGDDDLGEHYLDQGDDFHWKFRVNFFRSTLFFCSVRWGELEKRFTVFDTDSISLQCDETSTCFWSVRDEGIYFSCDNQNFVEQHKWL